MAQITRDGLTTRIRKDEPQTMSGDNWDAVIAVNLTGTWLVSRRTRTAKPLAQPQTA